MSIKVTITEQGLSSLINAQNTGSAALKLTKVKLGKGRYTPDNQQRDLVAPFKTLSTIAGKVVEDHLIHLTIKDESSDEYEVGEFGIYTDADILFAVYSDPNQENWILEKDSLATLLLAIDITLESVSTECIEFGSIELISPPATYNQRGVVQLADKRSVLEPKHDEVPSVDALHHYIQSLFVGQVAYFPAATAPNGWLVCDGASVLRSDYPDLWAFAQKSDNLSDDDNNKSAGQFGVGNGNTSFTLPDLRGEFVRGLDKGRGIDADRRLGSWQTDQFRRHAHTGNTDLSGLHDHSITIKNSGTHTHRGETLHAGEHSHTAFLSESGRHSHPHSTTNATGSHSHKLALHHAGYPRLGDMSFYFVGHGNSHTTHFKHLPDSGYHSHKVHVRSNGSHTHAVTINAAGSHQHTLNTTWSGNHTHSTEILKSGDHSHSFTTDSKGDSETRPRNIALLPCIKY